MNPAEYDRFFVMEERYWWFVGRRRVALMLLKQHLGEKAANQPMVLDLGCGTGVVSRDLGEWATALSLDMSPIALGYCKKRGLRRLMLGDGAHLPLQDASVDAVIALDIYEHIPDHVAAFKETYRVLKPGGLLVMSVPAFNMLWGPHDVAVHHCRRYRKNEVADRLKEAGFSVRRLTYSVFFLFPLVALVRLLDKRSKRTPRASLVTMPGPFNSTLIGLHDLEAALISKVSLPWGLSVIAVAKKPDAEGR